MRPNSEILVLCPQRPANSEIASVIDSLRLKYKSTDSIEDCINWLNLRSFGMLIVSDTIGVNEIKKLAEKLWTLNRAARVIILGLKGSTPIEALLLGAEIVLGPNFKVELTKALEDYAYCIIKVTAPAHILVVEDLDSPRDIICMFLEGLGYDHVTGVASAQAAIQALSEHPNRYTAVLTDVRMPGMSGSELIREIRRMSDLNRLPVIALTAYGTADCLLDCLDAGASGFLVKPPKKNDLQKELNRAERVRLSGASTRLVDRERVKQFYDSLLEKGLI